LWKNCINLRIERINISAARAGKAVEKFDKRILAVILQNRQETVPDEIAGEGLVVVGMVVPPCGV
jgi:plasmid stability protein